MSTSALVPPLSRGWAALNRHGRFSWQNAVGSIISLGVLVAALFQLRTLDIGREIALIPAAPGFWIALAAAYMALPLSEWVIYRRLWGLPIGGLVPLLRKRVSNEILLGYSGEVYFYAWAKKHATLADAPFGAIKDAAILSALVGNLVTLAMVALAWPMAGRLHLGADVRDMMLSCAVIVAISLPALLFRRTLLSLPPAELWRIGLIHLVRVLAGMLLSATMWHIALPDVALGWWLVLAALRQLLSRLPLLPNKDIAFAGLAAFLVGPHAAIAAMIAMTASLILLLHLVCGTTLALLDLLQPDRRT